MQKIRSVYQKIKELEVQGASAVAKAILLALKDYSSRIDVKNKKGFIDQFKKASDLLLSARPTEPLSSNVVKFLFFELKKAKDATGCALIVKKAVNDILKTLEESKDKISSFGIKLIENNDNIFFSLMWLAKSKKLSISKANGAARFSNRAYRDINK